jgi:hypothetical protein
MTRSSLRSLLAGSCIALSALFGCSSGPEDTNSGATLAGSGNGSAGTAGGGSSGSAPGVGGAGVGAGGIGAGGLVLGVDAGAANDDSDDPSKCEHLNIGILGNPGANASSNFQAWLVESGTSAQRIQTTADVPLTSAILEPFDVVILDWLTRDYTPAEADVFAAWVSAGGGVASMTGYNDNLTDDWHANSLLLPLEVAYSGSLANGPIVTFATHPITAGIDSVTFLGGYTVADLGGTASIRAPIAFLPNGPNDAAGIAVEMGKGRAVVWGDEWIEFDSEWSVLPQITQLWVQLFTWIAPTTKCALDPPR